MSKSPKKSSENESHVRWESCVCKHEHAVNESADLHARDTRGLRSFVGNPCQKDNLFKIVSSQLIFLHQSVDMIHLVNCNCSSASCPARRVASTSSVSLQQVCLQLNPDTGCLNRALLQRNEQSMTLTHQIKFPTNSGQWKERMVIRIWSRGSTTREPWTEQLSTKYPGQAILLPKKTLGKPRTASKKSWKSFDR